MLCYILAQYALFIYKNILLFFDIKKQSHLNCCRILNINLVIGICKSNSNKLQMLPTLTRHLQIQFQQVADASDPRICICKFISNKLQMIPTLIRHLQLQFQQVADASTSGVHPYMYLQIQFQQVADASDPRICICKSNSSKLQMLPTPGYVSANSYPTNCR